MLSLSVKSLVNVYLHIIFSKLEYLLYWVGMSTNYFLQTQQTYSREWVNSFCLHVYMCCTIEVMRCHDTIHMGKFLILFKLSALPFDMP
jgi:hypothetical protein